MKWLTNCFPEDLDGYIDRLTKGQPTRKLVKGEPFAAPGAAPLELLKEWGIIGIYEVY